MARNGASGINVSISTPNTVKTDGTTTSSKPHSDGLLIFEQFDDEVWELSPPSALTEQPDCRSTLRLWSKNLATLMKTFVIGLPGIM